MVALAAAIVAFAGPVLNPRPEGSDAPLVVLFDGGWGDAPDWAARIDRAAARARRGGARRPAGDGDRLDRRRRRPRAAWRCAPPANGSSGWPGSPRAPGRRTAPPGPTGSPGATRPSRRCGSRDGIGHGGEAELAAALLEHGPVTLVAPPRTALALTPPRLESGEFTVTVIGVPGDAARPVGVTAIGPDPNGVERVLGAATGEIAAGEGALDLALDLPVELRNRVGRVQLADGRSAAGVVLADDTVRRRKVGLMSGRAGSEAPGPGRSAALPAQGAGSPSPR